MHAAKHISQALVGAFGMTVGIEKARAFEQAGEHGAFGQRLTGALHGRPHAQFRTTAVASGAAPAAVRCALGAGRYPREARRL
jgi:hypothetical protein